MEACSSEGPKCPYCGYQITADEPGYYDEYNYTEEDCPKCERKYYVSVEPTVYWSTSAIDD